MVLFSRKLLSDTEVKLENIHI